MISRRRPIRKAVFPVAGLGTRLLPATKAQRGRRSAAHQTDVALALADDRLRDDLRGFLVEAL